MLRLTSAAFEPGQAIPSRYTCEGEDLSPPLAWTGVPDNALSLALIVDDPDAPDPKAPQRVWVHWVVYNIPPAVPGLPEGVREGELQPETRLGVSDANEARYHGPCPPIGRHRYYHKLFALDCVLPDLKRPTRAALEAAMKGHVIERAELMGTYQKGDR